MRTITITTILAALIVIPLIQRQRRVEAEAVKPEFGGRVSGDDLRYDINDFLT